MTAKQELDYQAGREQGRAAAETFTGVMTATMAPAAGTSAMFKAGWRLGFADVRSERANAAQR